MPSEHELHRSREGALGTPKQGLPTLAGRLAEAGWWTAGISSDSLGNGRSHLEEGFSLWLGAGLSRGADRLDHLRADRVTALALSALEEPGPRFLYVEYQDPTLPWVAWEPWIEDPLSLVSYALWWPGRSKIGWNKRLQSLSQGGRISAETLATWRVSYEAELKLLDREVGRLLDALPGAGIDASDWLVLAGLNGQFLGEHSSVGDGYDVYQEGVAVPVLIRGPGVEPGREELRRSAAELSGWLLAALGLQEEQPAAPLVISESWFAPAAELKTSTGAHLKRIRRAFYQGDHKLILDSRGPEEAYDLSADPEERSPVEGEDWIEPLREQAAAWLAAASAGGPAE